MPVDASSASIFLPEDVCVTGEVQGKAKVRLPSVCETQATTQSEVLGATSGQAQAPVNTVCVDPGVRLRSRGKLTRELESVANEYFMIDEFCGGETSRNIVRKYFDVAFGAGAKLVGGERVVVRDADHPDGELADFYLTAKVGPKEHAVSLRLLNKLSLASMFKPRTQELLLALKAKGVQYAAELGMTLTYTRLTLPGSVSVAMATRLPEVATYQSLLVGKTAAVHTAWDTSMAKGKAPKPGLGSVWKDVKFGMFGSLPEVVLPRSRT